MVVHAVVPAARPVSGRVRVPPSKSLHQRALVAAVLADGCSEVLAEGDPAGDVRRLAAALAALAGRPVPTHGGVEGAWCAGGLGASRQPVRIDLGLNATGFRFAVALAGLRPLGARTLVGGARRLLARPHRPLLRALLRLGGHARRRPSGAVRVIARPWTRGAVALPSGLSSQYASALLMVAARAGGIELTRVGDSVSDGYLGLTCEVLRRFGVPVERDGAVLRVAAGAPRAARFPVEADASSAAPWWAAAALTGGTAVVEGVPWGTCQPDAALLPVLERMGARVQATPEGWVRVEGPGGPLRGAGDVDLRDAPDLAPVVGALAAGAEGETRVVRAPHLRFKESDRVATVVAAVRAVGGDADGREDGFVVRGRPLSGGRVAVTGDHRIVLAFGVLGLVVPGVVLDGAEAVEKSYPGFLADLARAGGEEGGPSRDRP